MATFSTEKTFTYLKNLHWKEDNDSKDGYDVICDEYLFYRVRIRVVYTFLKGVASRLRRNDTLHRHRRKYTDFRCRKHPFLHQKNSILVSL